jgi:hypothetical protein
MAESEMNKTPHGAFSALLRLSEVLEYTLHLLGPKNALEGLK